MNLIRFLSASSRGLAHGAPPMGKYRLPHGRVFPEFGRKNPFGSKTSSPSLPEPTVAAGDTAKAALTQAAPPLPVESPAVEPTPFAPAPGRPAVGKRWVAGCGPLFRLWATRCGSLLRSVLAWRPWRARSRARKRNSDLAAHGPVQGELSLENVRVVRNDLSDTDYEVVLADTATASPVRRGGGPATARAKGSLGSLAERLFGGD